MSDDTWRTVDDYLADRLLPADPALDAQAERSAAAGLPAIEVSPLHGRLLHVLALARGARRVLEVGTLGGYSTTWLARALPADGRVVTLEVDPHHAEVARANLDTAGVAHLVDVRVGPAAEAMRGLVADGIEPFDLVFVDADKESNPTYLDLALQLTVPGSVVVVDNVVRGGRVADPDVADPATEGTRRLLDAAGRHPRLAATAVQTVGVKGHDGFLVAVVLPEAGRGA